MIVVAGNDLRFSLITLQFSGEHKHYIIYRHTYSLLPNRLQDRAQVRSILLPLSLSTVKTHKMNERHTCGQCVPIHINEFRNRRYTLRAIREFFRCVLFFCTDTHTHTHTHTKCISERVRYIHHDLAPYALSIASGIFSISSIHIHRRCQHNFVSNACTSRTLYHRLYRPSTIVYRCDCIFSRNLFGLKLVSFSLAQYVFLYSPQTLESSINSNFESNLFDTFIMCKFVDFFPSALSSIIHDYP